MSLSGRCVIELVLRTRWVAEREAQNWSGYINEEKYFLTLPGIFYILMYFDAVETFQIINIVVPTLTFTQCVFHPSFNSSP